MRVGPKNQGNALRIGNATFKLLLWTKAIVFSVYQRHSLMDDSDFSCGILYLPLGGPSLTLARYNGPSHAHGDIAFRPHIHLSSEWAIAAGRKPESEAAETDRFNTPDGALACLIHDFNLLGITAKPDNQRSLPL